MNGKKAASKSFSALFAVICVLCLIATVACAAFGMHHDCPGEHCPVCALCAFMGDLYRSLCAAGAASVVLSALLLLLAVAAERAHQRLSARTPVSLKVKLSD